MLLVVRRIIAYLPDMTDFQTIVDDFAFLDDWDDRYKYLIDLGKNLPPYPEDKRDDDHKVRGCASQVWLYSTIENNRLRLQGDSDAHIVRGLVAVVLALFDGKTLSQAESLNTQDALKPLDLDGHLTPQRSNGLSAMVARIQALAKGEQQ